MASSSKQLKASLLVVAALLLLICTCTTRGQAARPEPGSKDGHMPQRAVSAAGVAGHDHEKSGLSAAGVEMLEEEPEMRLRECEEGDEQEECLMRRTLVAHTDYIYTQGKHN